MKRIAVYFLALAAALMVPLEGTDVGKLQPVGLVQLYKENEKVVIVTDTGDSGVGESVEAAFENLEETTAGLIFLDTADFLLLDRNAVDVARQLEGYLKPTVRICLMDQEIDPIQAAEYLTVHRPVVQIKQFQAGQALEMLSKENDRLILK